MLGVIEQVAHRGEDGAPAPDDFLALLRQLDSGLPPLDETDLEHLLKLPDLHAECRLADRASFSGFAEVKSLGQSIEVAQLPKGNHGDKCRLFDR